MSNQTKKVTAKRAKRATKAPPRKKIGVSKRGYMERLPELPYVYATLATLVLILTTLYWSLQSARLQNGNADQLVNSYMFEAGKTFQESRFPAQHTFLLKWPLFELIHRLGATPSAFIGVTVGLTLVTVGGFAYILYRLERRPLVFGTLMLALASVLLLIPAQPYPGALLPVNLAMIATRNIEYLVFIASIYLLVTSRRLRSRRFTAGILCLTVLIASDKLFMTLSLGGAGLTLAWYILTKRRSERQRTVRWMGGSVGATILGVSWVALIAVTGTVHIVGQAATGPYGLVTSLRSLVQGVIYAVIGVLTNLGANPAFGTTVLKDIPRQAAHNLAGPGGIALIVNATIATLGLWAMATVIRRSLSAPRQLNDSKAHHVSMALIWTTVAAFGVFIITNHYYAADARYLSFVTFSLFITLAYVGRGREWRDGYVLTAGIILLISVGCGLLTARSQFRAGYRSLETINTRNRQIVAVLQQHPVQKLVGDYWRVLPAKLAADNRLTVLPLQDCTTPREALSSQVWQGDLHRQSFAYLLSFDEKRTDFPACTLDQVIQHYGRPNTSFVIAGDVEHPKEILLFYDHGAGRSAPHSGGAGSISIVAPIAPRDLPNANCEGPTTVNIVAHEDDDLLFLSPDLLHDLQSGHCVRTIYLTAGDSGDGGFFWLSRQRGAEAAYSHMLNHGDLWVERVVKLGEHQFVSVANPRGNAKVSLIFMHLPDGNLNGQGFGTTRRQSLSRLEDGGLGAIDSIDHQSSYTAPQLVSALTTLLQTYQPTEIHTQAAVRGYPFADHSDHLAVSRLAQGAHRQYESGHPARGPVPIKFYLGYPGRTLPPNVGGTDLLAKKAAFYAYGIFDSGVCRNDAECSWTPTYAAYLQRQYTVVP